MGGRAPCETLDCDDRALAGQKRRMVDAAALRRRSCQRGRNRSYQHTRRYYTRRSVRRSRRRKRPVSNSAGGAGVSIPRPTTAAGIISGCVRKRRHRRRRRVTSKNRQPRAEPPNAIVPGLVELTYNDPAVGMLFHEGENSNGPIFASDRNNSSTIEDVKAIKSRLCEKGKGKMTDEELVAIKKRVEAAENKQDEEPAVTSVCGICYNEKRERGKLDCCDHFFCFHCILEWSKVETRCPMCKQRFTTIVRCTHPDQPASRARTVHVPLRDQIYEPSDEEVRNLNDPYANIVCVECQEIGDEGLLLLCDFCDSAAHTYCVGLGLTVPRGDWFCECCRASFLSSNNQDQTTSTAPAEEQQQPPQQQEAAT